METQAKTASDQDRIHYPFFKNLLESQKFSWNSFERPFDIWKDPFGNTIKICEPCGILDINGNKTRFMISGNQPGNAYRTLINFLFNTKPTQPTNGNHKSNQHPS